MERVVFADALLLDTHQNAELAFSTRQLRTTYTGPCMRIREAGGDTEIDINFNASGYLNEQDIIAHCGANDGYVVTWYDQSRKANHVSNSTQAQQPRIYDGSSVIKQYGKNTLEWVDGQNHFLERALSSGLSQPNTFITKCYYNGAIGKQEYLYDGLSAANRNALLHNENNDQWQIHANGPVGGGIGEGPQGAEIIDINPGARIFACVYDGTSSKIRKNGVLTREGNAGLSEPSGIVIGNAYVRTSEYSFGSTIAELIVYNSDKTSSISGIEENLRDYYMPLQLDYNQNASAAYSVRRLNSDYTGPCMRVRESLNNTELDIGFDSNGDLDTSQLASHCSFYDGHVVTWYDQSGSGNHISNFTQSEQPQVYASGSHNQLNLKPAINFSNHVLLTSGNIATSDGGFLTTSVFSFDDDSGIKDIAAADATSPARVGNFIRVSGSVFQSRGFDSGGSSFTATGPSGNINFQHVGIAEHTGSELTAYLDGVGGSATSFVNRNDSVPFFVGAPNSGLGEVHKGLVQEIIHYPLDKSSRREIIEGETREYFVPSKILDSYLGAKAAFSTRKISRTYTGPCMRVRENGGSTELDIGFDENGNLDENAVSLHCGSNSGFVATWYDQSGNGNHATATTFKNGPPSIYDGVNVIKRNNRAAVGGETGGGLNMPVLFRMEQPYGVYLVKNDLPETAFATFYFGAVGDNGTFGERSGHQPGLIMQAGSNLYDPLYQPSTQTTFSTLFNGENSFTYASGQLALSGNAGLSDMVSLGLFGRRDRFESHYNGKIHEILFYEKNITDDRVGVETDLEQHYKVQTSKLLDVYNDAAVAYSVRKLSQWYNGACMRVRENSGDTVKDIGFDSNGNLDTAAIAAHCGSASGYVETWYDQSGNNQDAAQSDTTKQYQIYDGASVTTTDNGRPALQPNAGNTTRLFSPNLGLIPSPEAPTIMMVMQGDVTAFGVPLFGNVGSLYLVRDMTVGLGQYGINVAGAYVQEQPPEKALYIMKYGVDSATRSNGSERASTTGTVVGGNIGVLSIGGRYGNSEGASARQMQEIVLWKVDHYEKHAAEIEANVNNYFGIF
jgi:hypothetical protein